MAKTLFQYSTFYVMSLFFGMCLCGKKFPMFVRYDGEIGIGAGSITFGQWEKDASGALISTGRENMLFISNTTELFTVTDPEKIGSLNANTKLTDQSYATDNNRTLSVSLSQSMKETASGVQTIEAVEAEIQSRNNWVTFGISEINAGVAANEEDTTIAISAGCFGLSYPDHKLVSADDSIELFGYKTASGVRFMGDYAKRFQEEATTVSRWKLSDIRTTTTGSQTKVFDMQRGVRTALNPIVTCGGLIVDLTLERSYIP